MLINQLISADEDFGSGEVEEPVTLQEAKNYLRLSGFTDTDDSGEQDIDFDDSLILSLITEGRMWVEKYTGQYIVPRSLTVVLLNQAGGYKLPGPVQGSVTFTNATGDTITPATVGTAFPVLTCGYGSCPTRTGDYITAVYQVGYEDAPAWTKNSILAYIADHYEHRGDEAAPAPNARAAQIARPYRRRSVWG